MTTQTPTQIASEIVKIVKMITDNRNDFLYYENKLLMGKFLTERKNRKYKRLQHTNNDFPFRNQLKMYDKEILTHKQDWDAEIKWLNFLNDDNETMYALPIWAKGSIKDRIFELTSALKILNTKEAEK